MRLFVAIDFDDIKDYLINLQVKIPKDAKMSMVKSFHLTLKFLGEVEEEKIGDIIERLNNIKFSPFYVALGKIGIFPSENYIRVVWVG